ncbi:MAG TPA: hypothetical protein VNT02_16775 [Burkholderiales bacterium]|nr:hypothetical protein [Burkholderiales bacterium]
MSSPFEREVMHDTSSSGCNDEARASRGRCVFLCEYVPRARSWRWTWRLASDQSREPFSVRSFASLNDCLHDAVQHGFSRDHISIRYFAREPSLTLLEKFDDRTREFIRALKQLIPTPKARAASSTSPAAWQESAESNAWSFAGSPRPSHDELQPLDHLR